MKSFDRASRVLVKAVYKGVDFDGDAVGCILMNPPAPGVIARMRRDGGAWIALDTRDEQRVHDGVHPFPAGDPRERHVLAYPEDCEAIRG